ncbi:S8 family serine peptidase [Micromonospora sonneratiae]|uniref:S8 family serine peptidase n=1 Tax=Micromonospora sonneratiae TaxID=1184706 RepID=A0ABW3YEW0_9ACTN
MGSIRSIKLCATAFALAGLGLGLGISPMPATGSAGSPLAGEAPGDKVVTLLTGDRVYVGDRGVSRIVPGKGREKVRFSTRRNGDQLYVVPLDAVAEVASGKLDPRLFDVAGLIDQGYGDDKRGDLPLIVQGAVSGTMSTKKLGAVAGQALRVRKDDPAFWRTTLGNGAKRIWLDGMMKLSQDRSVPQIGAPVAWKAGYTGKGVTVGVLDSGVDVTHPDLAGKVAEVKDFTGEGEKDLVGHGTHVSATIASGDQKYRGVAPDASLVVGKVCNQRGGCPESAILAAMEWIAAEKHAKVVNMSFGGPDFAGVDLQEEAVNRLTAQYGTLFVSGAGNNGAAGAKTLTSPASADAALAVGAVDRDDNLPLFTSRGPRSGDYALKPDITAPGVGIVAASSKDGQVGEPGEPRAAGSGTSMAAPHVTGAAALLFQQHPDWTPAQVKSALMGSAKPTPGANAFAQGAGRVDLSQAIKQQVLTSPSSLSFGLTSWPHADDKVVDRDLIYQNTSDQDVTLALKVSATGPDKKPADVFRLSAPTVTVPAHGSAVVRVSADTSGDGPDGEYTGRVSATSGDTVVNTPIGVVREPESYDLTINTIDRSGQPAKDFAIGLSGYVDGPLKQAWGLSGSVVLRVPKGDYVLDAAINTGTDPNRNDVDFLVRPWLELRSDQTVTLDARVTKASPVTVERADAELAVGTLGYSSRAANGAISQAFIDTTDFTNTRTGQIGPDGPKDRFVSAQRAIFAVRGQGEREFANSPYVYHLGWFTAGKMSTGERKVRDADLAKVRTTLLPQGKGTSGEKGAGPNPVDAPWAGLGFPIFPVSLPGSQEELYSTEGVAWWQALVQGTQDDMEAEQSRPWQVYQAGTRYDETWNGGAVFGPSLPGPTELGSHATQYADRLRFQVPLFGTAAGTAGNSRTDETRTAIYRDGQKVCDTVRPRCVVEGPPVAGRYRVTASAQRSLSDMSTKVTGTWTFQHDGKEGQLPIQVIRFSPRLDQANTAPAYRPFGVPVSVGRNPSSPDARVKSLTVEVSYDDGETWKKAPVVNGVAWLVHPKQGYVSLRGTAVDSKGDSVQQTIIHAYRLR